MGDTGDQGIPPQAVRGWRVMGAVGGPARQPDRPRGPGSERLPASAGEGVLYPLSRTSRTFSASD